MALNGLQELTQPNFQIGIRVLKGKHNGPNWPK